MYRILVQPKTIAMTVCNIVKVKYDKKKDMVSEERIHTAMPLRQTISLVGANKEPLYFYVDGTQDTEKYFEHRNNKAKAEYAKEKD